MKQNECQMESNLSQNIFSIFYFFLIKDTKRKKNHLSQ